MSTDADIRTFLERVAAEPSFPPPDPAPAMRRARRKAARTVVVGAVGVAVAVAATFGGVSLLRSSPAVPAVPTELPPILLEGELLEAGDGFISALDPATGDRRRIVRTGCSFQEEDCNTFLYKHALSADGTWLAYDLWTCTIIAPCDPDAGLWVTNALGERHQLAFLCDAPGSCPDEAWAWSPDGATLAAYGGESDGDLVTIDPSTGEPTSVADPDGLVDALAWSPDGEQLAYAVGSTVSVVDLATGRSTPAFEGFERVIDIAWSPDGTRLLLEDTLGDGRILVADLSAGSQRVLVERGSDQPPAQPAWSPDGTRVAYFAMPPGAFEVWVVGADGSDATRVFRDGDDCCPIDDESPVWSPDGTRLALHGFFERPGGPSYLVVNADGTGEPEPIDALEVQDWGSGR